MQSGVREKWKINTRFVLIDGGIHMKCRWRGRCTHSTHKPSDGEKRERRTAAKWPNNSWLGCWFRSAVSWRNFYAAPAKKTWRREQAGKLFFFSRESSRNDSKLLHTTFKLCAARARLSIGNRQHMCEWFCHFNSGKTIFKFFMRTLRSNGKFLFRDTILFRVPLPTALSLSLSIQYIISISSLVAAAAAAAAPKESSKTSKTTPEEL